MTRPFAALVAALSVGAAVAAPVPKAPPPPSPKASATVTLATAKVSGQTIQITGTVTITYQEVVQEVVNQNGQQVAVAKVVTRTKEQAQVYQMALKGTKATTADGKEIAEEDLEKKLGDGGAVVQVNGTLDPEWKKVFADDVIFLEAKAVARPVFGGGIGVAPGGGPVVPPPPPIQVEILPVAPPPPPPPPLPVEKK